MLKVVIVYAVALSATWTAAARYTRWRYGVIPRRSRAALAIVTLAAGWRSRRALARTERARTRTQPPVVAAVITAVPEPAPAGVTYGWADSLEDTGTMVPVPAVTEQETVIVPAPGGLKRKVARRSRQREEDLRDTQQFLAALHEPEPPPQEEKTVINSVEDVLAWGERMQREMREWGATQDLPALTSGQ